MRLLDKHSGHRNLRCKAMAVAIATVSTIVMIFPLSGNAQADDMNGDVTEGKARSMLSIC